MPRKLFLCVMDIYSMKSNFQTVNFLVHPLLFLFMVTVIEYSVSWKLASG